MAISGVTPQTPVQEKQNFGFMSNLARYGRKMSVVGLFAMLGSFASSASASVRPAAKFVDPLAGIKKEMTFDQQFKEAISNAALNAKLEAEAYANLKEKVSNKVTKKGFTFGAIFGKSHKNTYISSKAQKDRKIAEYNFEEVDHNGPDFLMLDEHGHRVQPADRIGMNVNALQDGILTATGMSNTRKGLTGMVKIMSHDGHKELTYYHINPLDKKKRNKKSAALINPETGLAFKVGDAITQGQAFSKLEKGPFAPHVHIELRIDGVLQMNAMNNLIKNDGFIGKTIVETPELARKIGPSGTRAILNDMHIDEMYNQIEQENADRYDILVRKGMINAITDRIEHGLNTATKTNFGLQWKDNKEELRAKGFKNIAQVTQEAATEVLDEKYLVGNGLDKLETYGMKKFDKDGQENRIDERAMMLAYNMVMHFGPNKGVMKAIKKSGGDYTKILSNLKYRYANTTHHKENFADRYVTLKNMTREMTARMESDKEIELKGNFAERKKRLDNIVAPLLETEKEQVFADMMQKTEREKEIFEKSNLLANSKSTSDQKKENEDTRRLPVRKEELEGVTALISQQPETKADVLDVFPIAGGNPPGQSIAITANESFEKMQEAFNAKLAAKSAAKDEMKVVASPVVQKEVIAVEKVVVANWNDNKKLSQLVEDEEELLEELQITPVKRLGLAMRFAA